VRLSHHKARGRWFQARSAWPVREAPVHTLIRERERAAKSLPPVTTVGSSWECVGPTNIGGRITSLVCHPDHPERIWAGSAGGGVWRSNDAGQNWQSCWSDQDILNIGSLGIDQKNPDTIYCGTGEAKSFFGFVSGRRFIQEQRRGKNMAVESPQANDKLFPNASARSGSILSIRNMS